MDKATRSPGRSIGEVRSPLDLSEASPEHFAGQRSRCSPCPLVFHVMKPATHEQLLDAMEDLIQDFKISTEAWRGESD
jgi:hypothetical protein